MIVLLIISIIFSANFSWGNQSDPEPLFESGLFVGYGLISDYPAAEQSKHILIPLPIIRYRGELFRSEENEGTRFRFLKNDKFDLDLSFGGSFPVNTKENRARADMPNLDLTIEVGPRLLYYLFKDSDVGMTRVGVPLRAVWSTNGNRAVHLGTVLAPTFQWDRYQVWSIGEAQVNIFFAVNLNYISKGVAEYFYNIDQKYATSLRSSYNAAEGFLGYDSSLAFKFENGKKSLILAARLSDYTDSANRQSYLHRKNINWSFFTAFTWLFYESEQQGVP